MFNLEDQIQDWRRALSSEDVCGVSDLEELELHLREEIANLTDTGLSPAEAFMIATRRLGDIHPLAREFAKVNPNGVFRKRLLWMSIGILGYMLAKYCSTGLSKCMALLAVQGGLRGYGLGLLTESMRVALLIAGVLTLVYFIKRHTSPPALPKWLDPLRNKIILFTAVVILDAALFLGPIIFTVLTARLVGVEDFGKIARVAAYTNFLLPIVASIFLVLLVIRLGTASRKTASA